MGDVDLDKHVEIMPMSICNAEKRIFRILRRAMVVIGISFTCINIQKCGKKVS